MATVHEGKFQRALPLSYHCGHGVDGTGGLEAVGKVLGVGGALCSRNALSGLDSLCLRWEAQTSAEPREKVRGNVTPPLRESQSFVTATRSHSWCLARAHDMQRRQVRVDTSPVVSERHASEPPVAAFALNARCLAAAAVPTLLLADFAGAFLQKLAAFGFLLGYLLHAVSGIEPCLYVLWTTVIVEAIGQAVCACIAFGFSGRGVGFAALSSLHVVLVGIWASLQFSEWLHAEALGLAVLGERLLCNLLPITCAALTAWGAGALLGSEHTPTALLAALGGCHLLLSTSVPSSYAVGRRPASAGEPAPPPASASDASAAAAHAAALLLLPPLCHVALHRLTLIPQWSEHWREMRTLVCLALLILSSLPARDAQRWAPASLVAARPALQLGALVGLATAAHGWLSEAARGGASHNLLSIEPPYGDLLLGVVLGAPVLFVALHAAGAAHPQLASLASPPVASSLAALTLAAAVCVLKLPPLYQSAGLVSALTAAHCWHRPSAAGCALCSAGLTLLVHGVLRRSAGPLHRALSSSSSLGSSTACEALVLMTALCATAASCSILRSGATLRAACLLVHAVLLGEIEAALRFQGGALYPAETLLATTAAGLFLVERLLHGTPPPPTLWWLLLSAHAGRAALLLDSSFAAYACGRPASLVARRRAAEDGGRLLSVRYVDGALLVASLTQRLQIDLSEGRLASGSGRREAGGRPVLWPASAATSGGGASAGMGARAALLRLGLVSVATLRASSSLLPRALTLVLGGPAPSAVLLGSGLALYATGGQLLAGTLPPAARAPATRLTAWLVAAGAALAAVQPPLGAADLLDSVLWTISHPTASLTQGGTTRLLLWPPWLFLCVLLLGLAAALRLLPLVSAPPSVRLLLGATLGACSALSLCGSLLPFERPLLGLFALAGAGAGALLAACAAPLALARSPRAPPALLCALALLFPLGLAALEHYLAHSYAASSFDALPKYADHYSFGARRRGRRG